MADGPHAELPGAVPHCGDIILFEGERWKVVAVNGRRDLAIFVRPDPAGGKELRRTRAFTEFRILERGHDPSMFG